MAFTAEIWPMDVRDSVASPGDKELEYVNQTGRKYGAHNGHCVKQGGNTTDSDYYNPQVDVANRAANTSGGLEASNDVLLVNSTDVPAVAGSPPGQTDGMDYALLTRYGPGNVFADINSQFTWDDNDIKEVFIRFYQKWGDDDDDWIFPAKQQKFIGHLVGTTDDTTVNFWMQGQDGGTWGRLMFQPFLNGSQSFARWEARSASNESSNSDDFHFLKNVWYEIQIRWLLAETTSSSDGEAEFWINGEQRYLETGLDNYNGGARNRGVKLQNQFDDDEGVNDWPDVYMPSYMKNLEIGTSKLGGAISNTGSHQAEPATSSGSGIKGIKGSGAHQAEPATSAGSGSSVLGATPPPKTSARYSGRVSSVMRRNYTRKFNR